MTQTSAMTRRAAATGAALFAATLLVACGGDEVGTAGAGVEGSGEDESSPAADEFSVAASLAEIPADAGSDGGLVLTADLHAVCEANGCERPEDVADVEAVNAWLTALSGRPAELGDDPPPVVATLPESIRPFHATQDELAGQLGFSAVDVDTYVALEAAPQFFTVATGDGIADLLADDLLDAGDGLVSTSDADDLAPDLENVTPADQLGRPVHLAGDGDRVALSLQTSTIEAWRGGPASSLASDDDLAGIAAALDDAGVVSAVLDTTSDRRVGVGWAADGDLSSVVTLAYAHRSEAEAGTAADELETLFTEGADPYGRPMSDLYTLEDVTTDGSLVVVTLRPEEPVTLLQDLIVRNVPFD